MVVRVARLARLISDVLAQLGLDFPLRNFDCLGNRVACCVIFSPSGQSSGDAMKLIMQLMFVASVLAAALCFDIPASQAYGDAPWCAVVSGGAGDVMWDCQYRSIEECRPNVLAGNRGWCNANP